MEVAADEAGSMHAFRLNHAGIKGVHANLLWAELLRERDGDAS